MQKKVIDVYLNPAKDEKELYDDDYQIGITSKNRSDNFDLKGENSKNGKEIKKDMF